MKIEITFRDFRKPLTDDIGEQEADRQVDHLSSDDVTYMDLDVFLGYLREGKFGGRVEVIFTLTHLGEDTRVEGRVTREAPKIIEYTIASDDAPSSTYLDGLI